jgi:hypothetical protein
MGALAWGHPGGCHSSLLMTACCWCMVRMGPEELLCVAQCTVWPQVRLVAGVIGAGDVDGPGVAEENAAQMDQPRNLYYDPIGDQLLIVDYGAGMSRAIMLPAAAWLAALPSVWFCLAEHPPSCRGTIALSCPPAITTSKQCPCPLLSLLTPPPPPSAPTAQATRSCGP